MSSAGIPVRAGVVAAALLLGGSANAQETFKAPSEKAPSAEAAATVPNDAAPSTTLPEAPLEAPPPMPRRKGLVLEMGLGGLQFLGQFKHVAPLAPWMYLQVGYEVFKFLMVYGYGELSFADTSEAEGEALQHAFPIYGFGGGLRFTLHVSPRVALFLQGEGGAMQANVAKGILEVLGYKGAESLGATVGGRIGVEYYQVDRHMAVGLGVGVRELMGFKDQFASDTPLALDATAALRYTF